MKYLLLALLALVCVSCTCPSKQKKSAVAVSDHVTFLPEQIQWKDGPESLAPGTQYAVLEGDASKPGYFAIRLKFPDGYRVPPHRHPNVERVTVLAGTLYLGEGEQFDQAKAQALTAGSYSYMRPGMAHYAWTKGETILQLTTVGPWGIKYVNPADDPRNKK